MTLHTTTASELPRSRSFPSFHDFGCVTGASSDVFSPKTISLGYLLLLFYFGDLWEQNGSSHWCKSCNICRLFVLDCFVFSIITKIKITNVVVCIYHHLPLLSLFIRFFSVSFIDESFCKKLTFAIFCQCDRIDSSLTFAFPCWICDY